MTSLVSNAFALVHGRTADALQQNQVCDCQASLHNGRILF